MNADAAQAGVIQGIPAGSFQRGESLLMKAAQGPVLVVLGLLLGSGWLGAVLSRSAERADSETPAQPKAPSPEPSAAATVLLNDAEKLAGWGPGAALSDDSKEGKHSIAWTPTPAGAVAFLSLALSNQQREAVAHGKTLSFWYKFEGQGVKTFHLKVVAYPLAGGLQAVYSLPLPPLGEWRHVTVPLQQFDERWGEKPRTTGGALEFRITTSQDAKARLFLDDLRLTPLPAGVPVNSGDQKNPEPVTPLIGKDKPLNLPAHPRLLFSAADVPAMKERSAKTEWGKAYADALRTRGNEWLSRAIELPARGGQYWHLYACSKDGATLKTESPTRHVCPLCGKVYTGQPYDDIVLGWQHGKLAEGARDLGLLYQLAGDRRYAAKAREILLAYAERYLSYPLHNSNNEPKVGGGRVSCQTLEESIWLIAMAQAADAIWDTLSPADIETLKTKLFCPAAVDVIQKHRIEIHNIQCWKNSAVGLTGLLFGDAALVADAIDGQYGCQAQLAQGVKEDGAWFEGAWSYHFYTMDALHHLTEAALRCGINLYGDKYKKMFLAPLDLAMPDGNLPVFNDCMPAKVTGNPNYEIALARYKDACFAIPLAASNRRTLQAFVNGVQPLPAAAPVPQPSQNFPDSGYAILRAGTGADATWLCLKYGPHGGWHGHPDKNSFVLYAAGRVLAADPGTTQYGIPMRAGWYTTTLAHNTLVVDEGSQHSATGASLDFQAKEGWSASLTDAGPIHAGLTFRRAAFLLGASLVVFLDLVLTDDGTARNLDIACHLPSTWTAAPPGEAATPPDKPGYSYLRDLRTEKTEAGLALGVTAPKGAGAPATVIFAPSPGAPTTFWTATGVGANTEDRVPVVIARRRTASTAFAWGIAVNPAGALPGVTSVAVTSGADGAPVPAGEAAAALVRTADGAFLIVANPRGRAIKAGTWTGNDKLIVVKQ
jgi:hypothetical protein